MKYPKEQFEVLQTTLKQFAPLMDLKSINPSALHYVVFEQFSEGHKHNWLYCTPNGLMKAHKISDFSDCSKLIQTNFSFELYPNDCNDSNVESAVRKALKIMYPH